NGSFQDPIQATTFDFGIGAINMVAADFDGDDKVDIACLDPNPELRDALWVFRGNGDGTFADGADSGSALTFDFSGYVSGLAVGDFNLDGRPDPAVAFSGGGFFGQHDGVDIFLSRPTTFGFDRLSVGELQAPPSALTVADCNGDGLPDIAVVCDGER